MLAKGGRMVYSTCSLNPVEDEASIAEILRKSKGALVLVDPSKMLNNFKYRPGVNSWIVFDKNMKVVERETKETYHELSMFPPTKEEVLAMNLHFGMRILPQDMDTGGFFVAVFEKVSEMPNEESKNRKEKIILNPGKGIQTRY
jgi:16S rRNA C967 or C1407 C5-methylase (RsmB/RsmF family)